MKLFRLVVEIVKLASLAFCAYLLGAHFAHAQMNSYFPGPGMVHSTSSATTAWNPADKGTDITLSNGNLTATLTASAFEAVRAVASHVTTGKYYYEIHVDAATSSNTCVIGLGNASAALASFVGNNSDSIGFTGGGTVFTSSSNVGTVSTFAAGDTISVAVDLSTGNIWFRVNGGGWNNDILANQNPATNTGGINYVSLSMNPGPYFPMASLHDISDAYTANFGATAYTQTPPAGYGNW